MRGRWGVFIGITSLVSGVLVAVVSPPGWATSKPEPASHAGPPPGVAVAQGRVADPGGRAIEDASVVLYAWPGSKVLSRLHPGQRVPVTRVGSAVTSASGSYVIRMGSLAALRPSVQRNGVVNLEVMAFAHGRGGAFSFSRRLVSTSRGAALAPADSKFAGPVSAETANIRVTRTSGTTAGQTQHCGGLVFIKSYGPKWAIVGATASRVTGVKINFTYSRGQSSSLGVGINEGSGWSQSGSASESSTSQENFPTYRDKGSRDYETQFVYGLFGIPCVGHEVRPTSYAGGTKIKKITAPKARWCVWQQAGSAFTKSATSAFEFGAGLTVSQIGLSLSSHTGYDSGASVSFSFSKKKQLCGLKDFPGGASKLLVAGAV